MTHPHCPGDDRESQGREPSEGAVHCFTLMVRALKEHDLATFTYRQREMRRLWRWSILRLSDLPAATGRKGAGR